MATQKIILADDDPEDKSIIKEAMESIDARDIMLFASDGEQALSLLEELHKTADIPCLIVLDLNMPKMGGTETLEVLKNDPRFKAIPVIIYSTSVNQFEQKKCMSLGAHSYITKPISYNECVDIANIFLRFCYSSPVV